ncbi:MAG: hypothetical protein ACK5K7_00805 [Bacilli bacterium]
MWIIIVLLLVGGFYLLKDDRGTKNLNSEEMLKKKFIEGEISEAEFTSKMKVITGSDCDEGSN